MSKPPGLNFGIERGELSMYITRPSRSEDKLWDVISDLYAEGWSPERLKHEIADAWAEAAKEAAKHANAVLRK